MDEIDLQQLAEQTEFFTGADLKAVCREAALIHLRLQTDDNILSQRYFEEAIANFKPTLSQEMIDQYSEFEKQFG